MKKRAKRTASRAAPVTPPGPSAESFCYWEGDTLVLNILGKPGARQDAIGKPYGRQLKVSVTAAPHTGRATDHMVRFLAGEFGVPAGAIEVVFGRTSVNKQLRIRSPRRLPAVIARPSPHSPTPPPERG